MIGKDTMAKLNVWQNQLNFYFFVDCYICHIEPIDLFYEIFNDGMDKTQFKKMIDLRLIL